jgi:hypothetical protein
MTANSFSLMRSIKSSSALAISALFFAAAGFAHAEAKSKDNAATPAGAKAAYPLTTCVVSGDKLGGDMGDPVDYVYKQPGKPDQLIRFCCKDCIKDFEKDPAQYVKKLDDAAANKPKDAKSKDAPAHKH